MVNSYHHQAVKVLPEGFRLSGRSNDGVIEGIESYNHTFVIAAQCHFELLWEKQPVWFDLYRAFIKASEDYTKRK